jgi:thiamine-monophosphate kinase
MPDTDASRLNEFQRIERFFKPLTLGNPGALGLADDAALVDPPAGFQIVVTTDAMVAGVHFLVHDDPADIGYKLLAVNLSDLAAKGAEPLAYSLVTALDQATKEGWIERFAAGLGEAQRAFGMRLLGGDSVATSGPACLTISALGLTPTGTARLRSGARPGDCLFVTGSIGDALLGLRLAQGQMPSNLVHALDPADRSFLLARLRRPCPRTAFAPALRTLATAALDISDGLAADLGHMARASGVDLHVRAAAVPLSATARKSVACQPELLPLLLTGGDDYEVAFTAPPSRALAIDEAASAIGLPVACIGEVRACPPQRSGQVIFCDEEGQRLVFARSGYQHFSA